MLVALLVCVDTSMQLCRSNDGWVGCHWVFHARLDVAPFIVACDGYVCVKQDGLLALHVVILCTNLPHHCPFVCSPTTTTSEITVLK